jgi:hypothetical protein
MAIQREVVQQVIKSYFYVATWMSIRYRLTYIERLGLRSGQLPLLINALFLSFTLAQLPSHCIQQMVSLVHTMQMRHMALHSLISY